MRPLENGSDIVGGSGSAHSKRNLTGVAVRHNASLTRPSSPPLFPVVRWIEIKTLRATMIATSGDPAVGSRTKIRVAN